MSPKPPAMIDDSALQRMKLTAFEAASDASRWTMLVKDICRSFGASSAYFRAPSSPGMPSQAWWVDTGTADSTKNQYIAHWGRLDPWAVHPMGHKRSGPGRCFIGSDILPWEDLVRTAFYNDFGRTAGLKGVMSALVEDGKGASIAPQTKLALFREPGQPEFDARQLRAFETLQPALRRALHSYWAFQKLQTEASAVERTLEALPSCLCVLRRDGTVDYANTAAKVLDGTGLIRWAGGRLACVAQLPETRLLDLLGLANAGIPQEVGLWMPQANGFVTGSMHLTRLLPDSSIASHWPRADVLMLVQLDNAARTKETRLMAISALCTLTPAEGQVLQRLARGETAQAIAHVQGVGLATVRTHIRRLLEKTYSRRLVDLLRLVGD